MFSASLGYQFYAGDLTKSLQRTADEPSIKREKAYFEANIGKVTSVDAFLKDSRLFTFAMKAYGLEDMTYAKGLMRKVLTSDLSDPASLANKLSDGRYKIFAKAFSFTTAGTVAPTPIQNASQQAATVTQFESATNGILTAAVEHDATAYYQSHIGAVTSVTALQADKKLFAYVATAYGIDSKMPAAKVAALLESSLADSHSALNSSKAAGYSELAQAVNVAADGSASTVPQVAQSKDAVAATISAYSALMGTSTAAQRAGGTESSYYNNKITGITSVDQLLADPRLMAYVVKAFGLPSTISTADLKTVLTSDLSNPKSAANQASFVGYRDAAAAFNFATDGTLKTEPFQDATQQHDTVALYEERQGADTAAVTKATQYYEAHIGTVHSVADLEADSQLLTYVLTAYGVDPKTPKATIEQVLEDSLSDPAGIVAQTAGSHDLAFAQAFSVDAAGNGILTQQAQTSDSVTSTTHAYMAAAKSDSRSQATAARETAYYKSAISKVTSVGDMLGDKRLVAYITQAFALPAGTTTDHLRQILTADPAAMAKLTGTDKAVATAFAFASSGLLAPTTAQKAQSATQTAASSAAYLQDTMETEAGDQNVGIKLALYFQRTAPTITSAYGILADKALLQVFQTLLGLPATSGKANIDVQAKYIGDRVNFADFKDPAKLKKMVQRFAALYDMANPSDQTNFVAMLFAPTSDTTSGS